MRAKPFLTYASLAAVLALPITGHALGLGKLTVDSALGQALSAQIELTSATPSELDSLTVKVADAALYRQNNLAYNPALGRARVTLDRRTSGQPFLRVTTQSAINEPFLDLMVEVNWASGRLVREYTFLLDPPGVAPTPVEPTVPVRVGAAPARPAPAPGVANPAATLNTTPRAPAAPAPAPATAPAPAPAAGSGDTYEVKRGDTLSQIAGETKAPNVTLEQMLVAIYNTNPNAFDGNINRLRAGSIVTIPSADVAAATPPAEATKVVRMQAADWRTYRDRVAATAPSTDTASTRSAGGKIGTTVVESAPAVPPGRDQLKVSRDAGAAKAAATEEQIARERQIRDAQQRIAELEKTLNELQRAVEMKNQTMASLQAQVEAGKTRATETKAPPLVPPVKAAETPKAAEAPKAPEPTKVAEAPKAAEPPKAETAKAVPAAVTTPKGAPAPAPSFFDDLMANTPTWAIGAGAIALLAALAALIAARRRKSTRYEDGIVGDTDIKTNTVFGSTGGGVVNTGDNSLASEFSREGLGNIDTDEVDPIAEAEVYLAYGRDAQAEEILKHALRKEPQRQEIYLKLLEIHAQHNKPSAFETVAAELYTLSKGQGDTWQKAAALGRQLDPANPMFSDGKTAPVMAGASASAEIASFAKPSMPKTELPAAARAATASNEKSFDFRLDEDLAAATARGKSPSDILAGAERELAASTRASSMAGAGRMVAAGAAGAAMVEPVSESIEQKIETARLGADLDFHLDEADKPSVEAATAFDRQPHTSSQAAIGLSKLDLSFDDGKSSFDDDTPSILDGQWHDAATKLDLAKAYQEMGDVEGAREILQEVLREGDGGQKQEAQTLIAKLA